MDTQEGLKRAIGVWGLTANIINTVIGAGIFVLPALVSEGLGAAGLLAYIFCGFLITVVMLCFAEIGSRITVTGGAYAYIEAAFGKFAGFVTTNLFIFGAALMATAAVANAVADTLSFLFPIFQAPPFRIVFFLLLFTALTWINVRGVKEGITVVKATTILKIAPLLLLIFWGIGNVQPQNLTWSQAPSVSDFGSVSLILFFAFQGAENSLSISGEVRAPSKTVPRSILLATLIVLLVYLGVQVVAQGVLGDALGTYKKAPLAEVAQKIMGPFGTTLMILGAAISMFGYLSSDILNMPRVLFGAARDGVIPVVPLAAIHTRYATPHISIIVFSGLSCFFSIAGGFRQLAILSTSSVLLIYLGVAFAVIKYRLTPGDGRAGFRIPGGLAVPVLSVIIITWFLTNLTGREAISMCIFIVLLSIIYFLLNRFKGLQRKGTTS